MTPYDAEPVLALLGFITVAALVCAILVVCAEVVAKFIKDDDDAPR